MRTWCDAGGGRVEMELHGLAVASAMVTISNDMSAAARSASKRSCIGLAACGSIEPSHRKSLIGCSRSVSRPRLPQCNPTMSARTTSAARSRTLYSRPSTRPLGHDAVDPDNRLVAGELERRWNEKLVQLRHLEMPLDGLSQTEQTPSHSAEDRARLMTLGKDLAKAWNRPGVSVETRKKIIRLLIKEIIVDVVGDALALVIHWQGGDHSEMKVQKNKVGHTRWTTHAGVVDLALVRARQLPDNVIPPS